MSEEAIAPAEQAPETQPEAVRDAEAVLKQNAELLAEVKKLKPLAKKAEGFDFDAASAAIEAQTKAEQDRLTKKGEWDKLKEQLDTRHATELGKAKDELNNLLSNLKRERLTNVLTEKGVLPDRAKYLVHELDSQVELESTDEGFRLKKIGGIGDATEFDAMIENVKSTSPFFFAAQGASGSGASGSQNNGSGTAKTVTRSQWDAADPQQRIEWGTSITVTD